ncbi:MAG: hypothetical protein KGO02_21770 [Alphaproteobacteria bacterium]|nr:hypothetical protein [Alphaproteobacteria bacterium]
MFWIFGAVLHATAFAVVGFFVWFAASRTEGVLRLLGALLGAWLYLLVVLAIVAAVAVPWSGGKFLGMTVPGPAGPVWMHRWGAGCPWIAHVPSTQTHTPAQEAPVVPPAKSSPKPNGPG